MDKIELRTAMPEDGELTFGIRKAAFRPYLEKHQPWDEDEQRLIHEKRFNTQDFRILRLAGKDVGFLSMSHDSREVKLHHFFILPEHQSKGAGQKCMLLLMEEARQKGFIHDFKGDESESQGFGILPADGICPFQ
jgi:GNAT superfamily N-acetyltransferase